MNQNVNDILMSRGGKSATFHDIGDAVEGEVIRSEVIQQRDYTSGEPKVWPDGNPQQQIVIALKTENMDEEDDDGIRSVYVKVPSQMLAALRDAVALAKASGIEKGGWIKVTYTGNKPAAKRGMNPQKQYDVKYEAPGAMTVLPAEVKFCTGHGVPLAQSQRTGKWGHLVNGEPCFGIDQADPEMPF